MTLSTSFRATATAVDADWEREYELLAAILDGETPTPVRQLNLMDLMDSSIDEDALGPILEGEPVAESDPVDPIEIE